MAEEDASPARKKSSRRDRAAAGTARSSTSQPSAQAPARSKEAGGTRAATARKQPPRPTKPAAEPLRSEPAAAAFEALASSLRTAEVVLVHGDQLAIALHYAPGATPTVVAVGSGPTASSIIAVAHQMGLPLVDVPGISLADAPGFVVGADVPEHQYRNVAQALSLLYKASPSPSLVRFFSHGRSTEPALPNPYEAWKHLFEVAPLHLEVGTGVFEASQDIVEPILGLRQRIAMEMGLLLAPIPIRCNPHLDPSVFQIRLREVAVSGGSLDLPLDSPEKVFTIINRLKQIIHQHGWELLGHTDVEMHLDLVRTNHPGLVANLFPAQLSVTGLRQILRNLLREQLSIRDLVTILEIVQENLSTTQDPHLLTECVRVGYSRSLCQKYTDGDGYLNVINLHTATERILSDALHDTDGLRWLDLDPEMAIHILRAIEGTLKAAANLALSPVLLTTPTLRRFVSRMVAPIFPELAVLSYNEVAPLCDVRSVGTVQL